MNLSQCEGDRCFLTGCDENTQWMLPWFIETYRKFNTLPLVFVDFGVTQEMRSWLYQTNYVQIIDVEKQNVGGWFYKPKALYNSPYRYTCWIDTDIEILGDLSSIFNYVDANKLAMVEDKPWTRRRGERWHNSGVVAIDGKPPILKKWLLECTRNPKVGDQEVLHEILSGSPMLKLMHIVDLPDIYNWLRLQLVDGYDSDKKLCMHWTGPKGKNQIRKLIDNG